MKNMLVYEFLMSYVSDCDNSTHYYTISRIEVNSEKQAEELFGCTIDELEKYCEDGCSDIFYEYTGTKKNNTGWELKKCFVDGLICVDKEYENGTLMPSCFLGVKEKKIREFEFLVSYTRQCDNLREFHKVIRVKENSIERAEENLTGCYSNQVLEQLEHDFVDKSIKIIRFLDSHYM